MAKNQKEKKPRLPIRWLLLVGVVLLIYSIIGTARSIIDHQRNQRRIMFEVTISTWLGKPQGFYIDSDGDVYHFNLNQSNRFLDMAHRWFYDWDRGGPGPYTTAELFRYYGYFSEYSHTIPADELEYMFSLVDKIEKSENISFDTKRRDYPWIQFKAFRYSPYYKVHTPIYIQLNGDFSSWSDTPESETVNCWLEEVGYGSTDCSIRQEIIDRYEQIQRWEEED